MLSRSVFFVWWVLGCTNGEDTPPNPPPPDPCDPLVCPFPYSTWNGASPAVSLRRDLLADRSADKPTGGVLRRACTASACHDESPMTASLFIAPSASTPITEAHVDRFLGTADGVMRASATLPTMQIVKPGDPESSFLMRKIDGCFDDVASGCTPLQAGSSHPCGERMPLGSDSLCADERDMIRRWIAQGAKRED